MTYIVNIYKGRQGNRGIDGENGFSVSDVRESLLDNPNFSELYANKKSSITWNRTGEALIEDRYGNFQFVSGDDITNHLLHSNDFSSWADLFSRWTLSSTGQPDPQGGNSASYITLDATTTSGDLVLSGSASGMAIGTYNTLSFWFKVVSGTVTDIEAIVGGETFKFNADLSSNWQRLSVVTEVGSSSVTVDINPIGSSGAVIGIYKAQFENGSVVHDPIDTTTVPVTVTNPISAARQNHLGYLIEEQKTNLLVNTENLTRNNWSISGGTVNSYSGQGPFGDYFQNILISFNSATVFLDSTLSVTEGASYSVSFFAYVLSGTVTSITTALANGDPSTFTDEIPKSKFVRLSTKLVAGASGGLKITCISPDLTGQLLLTGFQVESGDLSSYIRTGTASIPRPEDDVNSTYNLPRPDEAWSCVFSHALVPNDSNVKYVFNNGLSGGDEFSCWFISDELKINIGGVVSTFPAVLDSTNIGLVFDGANIFFYKDGFSHDTQANSGTVSTIASNIYLGGDETSSNSINAYLSKMNFWDSALTLEEMRYLTGV